VIGSEHGTSHGLVVNVRKTRHRSAAVSCVLASLGAVVEVVEASRSEISS
jgi:hypothetical protein